MMGRIPEIGELDVIIGGSADGAPTRIESVLLARAALDFENSIHLDPATLVTGSPQCTSYTRPFGRIIPLQGPGQNREARLLRGPGARRVRLRGPLRRRP